MNSCSFQIKITYLLIDPFYRTIKSFAILIEKEWISFDHRLQDRNGYLQKGDDQKSLIFLPFIDCVHHVFLQFPDEFEFNQDFLLFIVEQSYSVTLISFSLTKSDLVPTKMRGANSDCSVSPTSITS
eukprot:gene7403-11726_t